MKTGSSVIRPEVMQALVWTQADEQCLKSQLYRRRRGPGDGRWNV